MVESKILVIDDDPAMLKLTAAILRRGGYTVHIASTAEQALVTLQTLRADAILVDLRLPGLNGLAFTQRIRESPQAKHSVVLAMTASSEAEIEAAAEAAGCDGFLKKPFDPEGLTAFVRRHLPGRPGMFPNAPAATGERDPVWAYLEQASGKCRALLRDLDAGTPGSPVSQTLRQLSADAQRHGFDAIPPLTQRALGLWEALWRDPPLLRESLNELLTALESLRAAAATPEESSER